MPEGHGYPNESEQERKQRIKKLKARTSKMRLAIVEDSPYMKESIPKNTTSSSNFHKCLSFDASKHVTLSLLDSTTNLISLVSINSCKSFQKNMILKTIV